MDNKQLTNSNFGKWGWSMILYTALLYYFWSGIGSDGLNLYPSAFAAMHGWDSNQLLGFATPAGIIAVFGGILFGRMVMKTGRRAKRSAKSTCRRNSDWKKTRMPPWR